MIFIRHPLFTRLRVVAITLGLVAGLLSTVLFSVLNAEASSLSQSHQPGRTQKLFTLPPQRLQIHSSPLRQPINPPKRPVTLPVRTTHAGLTASLMSPTSMTGLAAFMPTTSMTGLAAFMPTASTCSSPTIDLKVLILASDGTEVDLPAIKQALDYLGTPYTVYIASKTPNGLTSDKLSNGCHGYYQGIILTNGQLVYYNGTNYVSALSQQEWTNLWSYEADLGVRELSWYTYPSSDFGYQSPTASFSSTTQPVATQLTSQAQNTFPYVTTGSTVTIQGVWAYLAQPLRDGGTVPFLTDSNGNALAAVRTTSDGRQTLSLTFDSNQYLVHDLVLSYGLINWVTKGLFLGERHVYTSAQVDDFFIAGDIWTPSTPCGTPTYQTGSSYRITGTDLQKFITWQQSKQAQAVTKSYRTTMAFNGYGATSSSDTLTSIAKANQAQFNWVNHTYDHINLDSMSYADAVDEVVLNNQVAQSLGFTNFNKSSMVTPEISGLTNTNFLQAAYDNGIRYLVSNTSMAGYNNPSPNAGIYDTSMPSILLLPRYPNNLFYNVSQPNEWVAEYNCLYSSYWGKNLTYQQILDQESQTLLTYLLKGDIDPLMLHQPNMRAYDGTHSLMGDLLDLTFKKYAQYFNLPVVNKTMNDLGATVASRMSYNNGGVTASIVPGVSITLTAKNACTVPVTGVNSTGAETYGGQKISYVSLKAGQSVTLSLK
jgi:hypothetical protein